MPKVHQNLLCTPQTPTGNRATSEGRERKAPTYKGEMEGDGPTSKGDAREKKGDGKEGGHKLPLK